MEFLPCFPFLVVSCGKKDGPPCICAAFDLCVFQVLKGLVHCMSLAWPSLNMPYLLPFQVRQVCAVRACVFAQERWGGVRPYVYTNKPRPIPCVFLMNARPSTEPLTLNKKWVVRFDQLLLFWMPLVFPCTPSLHACQITSGPLLNTR